MEGRKDSLKLEFEEYLKREKNKKRKKTKGQPSCHLSGPREDPGPVPLMPQQHASEVQALEE